jgi:iron complex transport system ATP-binding protein
MNRSVLQFAGVSYSYGLIRGVLEASFEFGSGILAGIVGPNGSGKSTLLKLACGLLDPDRGTISVNGEPVSAKSVRQRALDFSYCAQDPVVSFPFSVREVVMFGRTPRLGSWGLTGEADDAAVTASLQSMDCARLAERTVDELSGGERKRVMLARAIAQETPIMVLDEPTSGLDIGHQVAVMKVLKGLSGSGKLVLTSIHDLNEASAWCDTILFMNEGRIIASGPPAAVLTGENILKAFGISVDFTTGNNGSFFIIPSLR